MAGATKLLTAGGGGTILTPASSIASDVTVQVPSADCVLGIQGPAFSAYAGTTTSVPNATSTKITFNTEDFDTANCFSSSRFTPNVAGYYQINAAVYFATGTNYGNAEIFKNGSEFRSGPLCNGNGSGITTLVSSLVYLNGSTDYVEIYGYQSSGGTTNSQASQQYTWFNGSLVRAA